MDREGSSKSHVQAKAASAAKMGLLRRQSMFLSESATHHVYISCIRPILEYCSPLFSNVPQGTLALLDKVQSRACHLFPSKKDLLDPLCLRRDVAGLCVLHQIVHGGAPKLVSEQLPVKPVCPSRSTRGSESNLAALQVPKCRTEFYRQSFLPKYIRSWNDVDQSILLELSTKRFKSELAKHLRKPGRDTPNRVC